MRAENLSSYDKAARDRWPERLARLNSARPSELHANLDQLAVAKRELELDEYIAKARAAGARQLHSENGKRITHVYNTDGESDDGQETNGMQGNDEPYSGFKGHIQQWREKGEQRNDLVVVIGERHHNPNIFELFSGHVMSELGPATDMVHHRNGTCEVYSSKEGRWTVMAGLCLADLPEGADEETKAAADAKDKDAIETLASIIGEGEFHISNSTSDRLVKRLGEYHSSQGRPELDGCQSIVRSSMMVPIDEKVVGANRGYSPTAEAYTRKICKEREIPLIDAHGLAGGIYQRNLSELAGSSGILTQRVRDPRHLREAARFSMAMTTKWLAETFAFIEGKKGKEVVDGIKSAFGITDEGSAPDWLQKLLEESRYSKADTNDPLFRLNKIPLNVRALIDNAVGDVFKRVVYSDAFASGDGIDLHAYSPSTDEVTGNTYFSPSLEPYDPLFVSISRGEPISLSKWLHEHGLAPTANSATDSETMESEDEDGLHDVIDLKLEQEVKSWLGALEALTSRCKSSYQACKDRASSEGSRSPFSLYQEKHLTHLNEISDSIRDAPVRDLIDEELFL